MALEVKNGPSAVLSRNQGLAVQSMESMGTAGTPFGSAAQAAGLSDPIRQMMIMKYW